MDDCEEPAIDRLDVESEGTEFDDARCLVDVRMVTEDCERSDLGWLNERLVDCDEEKAA